jgi:tRNA(Ile)-lysidine synthase
VYSPPLSLVKRFTADFGALGLRQSPLGVAVSGGADSLALLLLAHAAFPGEVKVATVDHCLRRESGDEARYVADLCATLGVPHVILRVSVASGGKGRQGEARRARYAALGIWAAEEGLGAVLTAHHQDDQAETLLMRLLRGSGVAGLAGIRPRTILTESAIPLLRPLLAWRRDELAKIVEAASLSSVDDPSNRDESYDRPRIRRLLSQTPWLDPPALARSAAALGEAEEALSWATERLSAERIQTEGAGHRLYVSDLPAELRRRLVTRILSMLAPDANPRGEQLTDFVALLEGGKTATLAGVKARGGEIWEFEPAPPRRLG